MAINAVGFDLQILSILAENKSKVKVEMFDLTGLFCVFLFKVNSYSLYRVTGRFGPWMFRSIEISGYFGPWGLRPLEVLVYSKYLWDK